MNKNRISLFLIVLLTSILLVAVGLIFARNTKTTKNSLKKENNSKTMKTLEVKNDLQKHGIEVVGSTDFNFDAELRKYVGANESLISLVDSAKPFAFFIKNNSSKEVVGISLRWKFSDVSGKNIEIPQTEANPGVLMGIKPIDPYMVGKTSLINSNDLRFFCYFSLNLQQTIVNKNMGVKYPAVKFNDLSTEELQKAKSFVKAESNRIEGELIDVSIDGVFFNDGTFVGEDKNYFFDSLNGEIQARRDFVKELNQAKLSGKSDSEFLNDFISKNPENFPPGMSASPFAVNSREAFERGYKASMINIKRGIVTKRKYSVADDLILRDIQTIKDSDFPELRKLN